MSDDYTTLNPMTGGAKIVTEEIVQVSDTGTSTTLQMPVSKLRTGPDGRDDGDVADTNPLHVRALALEDHLVAIRDQNDQIIELLQFLATTVR